MLLQQVAAAAVTGMCPRHILIHACHILHSAAMLCYAVLCCAVQHCSAHGSLEMRMNQISEAMGLSEHDIAVLRLAIRHGLDDPCQPFEVLHYTALFCMYHLTYFMLLLRA
jgi:hypothetical protein